MKSTVRPEQHSSQFISTIRAWINRLRLLHSQHLGAGSVEFHSRKPPDRWLLRIDIFGNHPINSTGNSSPTGIVPSTTIEAPKLAIS